MPLLPLQLSAKNSLLMTFHLALTALAVAVAELTHPIKDVGAGLVNKLSISQIALRQNRPYQVCVVGRIRISLTLTRGG